MRTCFMVFSEFVVTLQPKTDGAAVFFARLRSQAYAGQAAEPYGIKETIYKK